MITGASTAPPYAPAGLRQADVKGDPCEPEHHALGLSRGGLGTKIHLITDGAGLPPAFRLTPCQRHEVAVFEALIASVSLPGPRGRPRTRPTCLLGDKGYSYRPVYAYLRRRGIRAVIPNRKGTDMDQQRLERPLDPKLHRRRNAIERCVGWLKGCQSIATRHEKLAINFAAIVSLAILRQYLRVLCPEAGVPI